MRQIILLFLFATLLLVGCASNSEVKQVEQPSATLSTTSNEVLTPTPEIKTAKEAEVGQTLGNDKLKVTLNSVEFKEVIQGDNEYLKAEAKEGKTFVIVDVTVENGDNEPTTISSLMQFKVKDKDQGFSYSPDLMASVVLKQQIDGKIQPGDKTRGKIAFEVPKDANSLQMVFDFGLIDLAQAKFNLGKVPAG